MERLFSLEDFVASYRQRRRFPKRIVVRTRENFSALL